MRIPPGRFTIRSMMILVFLIGIALGSAMTVYRLNGEQPDDGFINDPMHPRWRSPTENTITNPDANGP